MGYGWRWTSVFLPVLKVQGMQACRTHKLRHTPSKSGSPVVQVTAVPFADLYHSPINFFTPNTLWTSWHKVTTDVQHLSFLDSQICESIEVIIITWTTGWSSWRSISTARVFCGCYLHFLGLPLSETSTSCTLYSEWVTAWQKLSDIGLKWVTHTQGLKLNAWYMYTLVSLRLVAS